MIIIETRYIRWFEKCKIIIYKYHSEEKNNVPKNIWNELESNKFEILMKKDWNENKEEYIRDC